MPTEQAANPMTISPFIPMIIIFLIWYLLIIKPQREKQTQHKKTLEELKKNDEIVTAGGIHATVVNVKEKTLIVRIDDNVKVEIDKEAVSTVSKKAG